MGAVRLADLPFRQINEETILRFLLLTSLLIFPLSAAAQENAEVRPYYDPKFYCDAQERFLSDEDFVRLALRYELEKQQAGYPYDAKPPDGYEIGSEDEFLAQNSDSYSVERDPKNMRNGGGLGGWIERWFNGEQIAISILLPSGTVGEPKLVLIYFTDECGTKNMDRTYWISNHYMTE
jgi:hypothetical protein